ncbi:hypothetical protein C7999DRAFT_27827 [Corynascus novoguineensis]|uniref:Uncharacterized protein n=1 Tax=Corynascus novoguineensis TaxID=1126955 RepID=A0AAN7HUY7_9PEZI|nr:hypothetical protein C7999DRAFT_27827 [Corynascus novoguineensis]
MLSRAATKTTATTTGARPLLQSLARRQLLQQQQHQRRLQPFSIVHNLRAVARSFEPHPFQRLPAAGRPAPADWAKLVRRSLGQAVVYV